MSRKKSAVRYGNLCLLVGIELLDIFARAVRMPQLQQASVCHYHPYWLAV